MLKFLVSPRFNRAMQEAIIYIVQREKERGTPEKRLQKESLISVKKGGGFTVPCDTPYLTLSVSEQLSSTNTFCGRKWELENVGFKEILVHRIRQWPY